MQWNPVEQQIWTKHRYPQNADDFDKCCEKEARHKTIKCMVPFIWSSSEWINSLWFHPYNVQKQAELIYSVKNQYSILWESIVYDIVYHGKVNDRKAHRRHRRQYLDSVDGCFVSWSRCWLFNVLIKLCMMWALLSVYFKFHLESFKSYSLLFYHN